VLLWRRVNKRDLFVYDDDAIFRDYRTSERDNVKFIEKFTCRVHKNVVKHITIGQHSKYTKIKYFMMYRKCRIIVSEWARERESKWVSESYAKYSHIYSFVWHIYDIWMWKVSGEVSRSSSKILLNWLPDFYH
jgi:hypothetical protein